MLNDMELVEDIFTSCKDVVVQKQMASMLARRGVFLELSEDVEEYEDLQKSCPMSSSTATSWP